MKKQALTLAIAAALSAPSALAAQDTSGMHYTSAAEGFYASLRVGISTSGYAQDFESHKNDGADIGGVYSRFGVRGTNDLGGGMEGFYQYEARIDHNQNSDTKTRLAHVGLRGAFGEVVLGTFWNNLYNFSYSATDVANNFSGNFVSSSNASENAGRGAAHGARPLPNRLNSAIQYTTPDLNGFKGSMLAVMDNRRTAAASDSNDVDSWGLAAKYDVQGFSMGASWLNNVDGNAGSVAADVADLQTALRTTGSLSNAVVRAKADEDDQTTWTVKLGYGQDNWYVNGWYGQTNTEDNGATYEYDSNGFGTTGGTMGSVKVSTEDTTYMSVAAGVSLDKVNLYALYETREAPDAAKATIAANGQSIKVGTSDYSATTLGAQYNLGAQSRVFLEYWKPDSDSNKDTSDVVLAGLRHDF